MKARVKSTGEIINVIPNIYDENGLTYDEVLEEKGMFCLKTYSKYSLDFNIDTMEEIKIQVPEGMEIDLENSFLEKGIVKLKKKKVKLPKSWEEVDEHTKRLIDRRLTFSTPDKYEYLMQLEILRNIYRQGWEPDWTKNDKKYIIAYFRGKIGNETYVTTSSVFLSFQSPEIRDEFYENFKDLIEECKDFI